jgi:hypothetical protein
MLTTWHSIQQLFSFTFHGVNNQGKCIVCDVGYKIIPTKQFCAQKEVEGLSHCRLFTTVIVSCPSSTLLGEWTRDYLEHEITKIMSLDTKESSKRDILLLCSSHPPTLLSIVVNQGKCSMWYWVQKNSQNPVLWKKKEGGFSHCGFFAAIILSCTPKTIVRRMTW